MIIKTKLKTMKINVTKIIHRATQPNTEGLWLVWCQIYVNGNFRYTALEFDSYKEAQSVKENDFIEVTKL